MLYIITDNSDVIPLELEVSSGDFLSFPQIILQQWFLLPLFPVFSTKFRLKIASGQLCLAELPQNCHKLAKNFVQKSFK
jgi:hypothetical protein